MNHSSLAQGWLPPPVDQPSWLSSWACMWSQPTPSHGCSEALNEERTKRQELQEAMQQVRGCQLTSCACRWSLQLAAGQQPCARLSLHHSCCAAQRSVLVFLPTPTCRWC